MTPYEALASQPLRKADEEDDGLFALVETIEALSSARTVEDVAAVVRSSARRISGADGVAVVLRDGDECHYVDEDAIGPLWKGKRFPMSACVSGWAMLNGETTIIPDIYQDVRVPYDAYRPTFVKSMVMTPVRPADPVAAIGAYWATERQPTRAELHKLEVMARATAVAIESARLRTSLEAAVATRDALVAELDHRVRNTLAAALSISNQTLRTAASPQAFNAAFEERVFSMAGAHELLAQADWGPVSLEAVVRSALSKVAGADSVHVVVSGPPVSAKAEAVVALHLALHELAINAQQYGALHRRDGVVHIDWRADGDQLRLVWRETGGPTVTRPKRTGFGRRLLEQGLPRDMSGKGVLTFAPTGVTYELTAPFSARLSPG